MKVTLLKRRGGKTTLAIKECIKTGAILVVGYPMMRHHLEREYPLLRHRIMTFEELLDGGLKYAGLRDRNLVIDDADFLLQQIASTFHIQRIMLSKPFSKGEKKQLGLSPNQDY